MSAHYRCHGFQYIYKQLAPQQLQAWQICTVLLRTTVKRVPRTGRACNRSSTAAYRFTPTLQTMVTCQTQQSTSLHHCSTIAHPTADPMAHPTAATCLLQCRCLAATAAWYLCRRAQSTGERERAGERGSEGASWARKRKRAEAWE